MSRQVLSARQLAWLLVTFLFTAYHNLGWVLARAAGHDSIFSYAVPFLYALLIALLFYRMNRKFPGKNMFEISFIVAGKAGGTVINVVMLVQIWMIFASHIMHCSEFLSNVMLHLTPMEITTLLFVLVMIYYGKTSIEVVARVNQIVFIFFFLLVFVYPLLLINEISLPLWEPVLTQTPAQIALGNVYGMTQVGDMFVVGAFLHTLKNSKQLHAALRHGIALSVLTLTWVVALCVAVFGDGVLSNLSFPAYNLSTQMNLSDFLDRIELILFAVYLPLQIISTVFIFFAFLTGFTSFSPRSGTAAVYSRSLGWFLMLTAIIAFRNSSELSTYYLYSYPFFTVIVQPLIMILFYVLTIRFRDEPVQAESSQGGSSAMKKSSKLSNGAWMRMTNGTAFGVVGIVAVGLFFASDYPLIGNLCFLAYILCMLLAAYTSYNEVKTV